LDLKGRKTVRGENCITINIIAFILHRKLSRRMRWAVHVARMGQGRGAYRVFVGRPEGKRPLVKT
jgi:hypothetical protein